MANQSGSTLAILGLLAVLGYQNRDKIAAAINHVTSGGATPGAAGGGLEGMLGGLLGGQGGTTSGGLSSLGGLLGGGANMGGLGGLLGGLTGQSAGSNPLSGGIGDIIKSFTDAGHGQVANSWVDPSVPTQAPTPQQVQQALGDNTLQQLAQNTGLSTDEISKRLATAIPQTVDKLTPNGQLPNEKDARAHLAG